MNALIYLFFTKIKAAIRNVFSRPASAILTFLGLVFVVGLTVLIFIEKDAIETPVVASDVYGVIMFFLAGIFAFGSVFFLQKRMALVYSNDANYIFAGPFSRKQILTYLCFDNAKAGLLYAAFVVFYICMMAGYLPGVTPILVVLMFFHSLLCFFIILSILTYLYLLSITNKHAKVIKIGLVVGVLVITLALFAKSFIVSGFDIHEGVSLFLADDLFYFLPVFGFTKWSLVGYLNGNMLSCIGGFVLNIVIGLLLWYFVVNIKGNFYEQVMDDALWADEVKKNAKQGKTKSQIDGKVHDVKDVNFKEGAGAIYSRNMLELKKTRSFFDKRQAFLMLFYLAIAYFIGMGFTFFKYYIFIILISAANADYMMTDLKKHYIYLIPDSPLKKIMALIRPIILKMIIVVIFGLTAGFILFRPSITEYLLSIVEVLGYGTLFIAASVWTIRILKSGTNPVAEQFIKLFIVLLAAIPAVAITLVIIFVAYHGDVNAAQSVATVVSVATNLIMGFIFIFFAKNMLKGSNVMSD